jgi:hypothetical protein
MPNAETLLWLNDRVGQEIHVALVFTTPDWEHKIFADFNGAGILRHLSEGRYAVGEQLQFDTTDLDAPLRKRGDYELALKLADGVALLLFDRSRPAPKLYEPLWPPPAADRPWRVEEGLD